MWPARGYALVCSLAGAVLSAIAALCWQFLLLLTGSDKSVDFAALGAVALLGAALSGLVAGLLSLLYQRRMRRLENPLTAVPPSVAPASPPSRKKRGRGLRARASADPRGPALSPRVGPLLGRRAA